MTVGQVEGIGRLPRRFARAPLGTGQPAQAVRTALSSQGWKPSRPVTVISDSEPAMLNLVRAATGDPVRQILDRWHLSTRVCHIEQALAAIFALRPTHQAGLVSISVNVERLRHLIWNGCADEAGQALWALTPLASEASRSPKYAPPPWGALRPGGTQVSAPQSGAAHRLGQQRRCTH